MNGSAFASPRDTTLQTGRHRAVGKAGIPLLESKLHVPRRRRGVIPRARLDARLDRDALPAVVLVSAPAGFGKTTLRRRVARRRR